MGVKHVAVGAAFSRFAGFAGYPLLSGFGLADLFHLHTDAATARANHGPGAALTVVGTPTYEANTVTCSSSAAFVTGTLDTANDTTLAGVFLPIALSSGASVVGNFATGLSNAYGLWTANGTALNLAANGASIDNTTSPALSPGLLHFAAARCVGTQKSIVVGLDGALVTVSETFTRGRSATEYFRVGGDNYPGGVNSSVTVAAAAVHKQGLSDAALLALYDYMRWYYAGRGVVVA